MYEIKNYPQSFSDIVRLSKYKRKMNELGLRTNSWSGKLIRTPRYIIMGSKFRKNVEEYVANPKKYTPIDIKDLKLYTISKENIESILRSTPEVSLVDLIIALKRQAAGHSYSYEILYAIIRTIYEYLDDGFYITASKDGYPASIIHVTFEF